MNKKKTFLIPVDQYKNWTEGKFREVDLKEMEDILQYWAYKVMELCAGRDGSMAMWAYFKSRTNNGCYSDAINAYRILTNDSKSLVDLEHNLRHTYDEWRYLWAVRYYGSYAKYQEVKTAAIRKRFNEQLERQGIKPPEEWD